MINQITIEGKLPNFDANAFKFNIDQNNPNSSWFFGKISVYCKKAKDQQFPDNLVLDFTCYGETAQRMVQLTSKPKEERKNVGLIISGSFYPGKYDKNVGKAVPVIQGQDKSYPACYVEAKEVRICEKVESSSFNNQQQGYNQQGNNYNQGNGYSQQGYSQPNYNQPSYNQPSYNQPSYNQPSYNQPSYNQQMTAPPSYNQQAVSPPNVAQNQSPQPQSQPQQPQPQPQQPNSFPPPPVNNNFMPAPPQQH